MLEDAPASIGSAAWMAIVPFLLIAIMLIGLLLLLPWLQERVLAVKPVFLNALIITLTAGFIFSQNTFGGDDIYKYVNPYAICWLRYGFGMAATMLLALKGFLSTDYATHLKLQKDAASDTVTQVTTDIHTTAKTPTSPEVPAPETVTPPKV